MSRLDRHYLEVRGLGSWQEAFAELSNALGVKPSNLRLLRDEFDPIHDNPRQGWYQRELRPTRQQIVQEFGEVSNTALVDYVSRVIEGEADSSSLKQPGRSGSESTSASERARTGYLAEEYFRSNCREIAGIPRSRLIDCRHEGLGFDFGVRREPHRALEVKRLSSESGGITFTDREWCEAKYRGPDYWLVIIGNLAITPSFKVIPDPFHVLEAHLEIRQEITASWRSRVTVSAS